ncbi:MAG: hypothetical protein MI920_01635 [Kiloniellales bacterium]|nr:hypothetical protein [Kiloniellales bacterium]
MIRSLAMMAFSVALAACGPVYKTVYEFDPPRSAAGLQCVQQCWQNQSLCRLSADSDERLCLAEARAEAERRFVNYRLDRLEEGKKVEKRLSDFDHSYRCRYRSFGKSCEPDFRVCYVSCGGQVRPYRVCTAFCDQQS